MSGGLVALTGATGFIGRHLLADLQRRGWRVRILLRRPTALSGDATSAVVGDLTAPRNMAAALQGVDAVVHSAGVAHAMSGIPEDDYRALNTDATVALARAARRAGAKRFVFLSSIRAQSGPAAAGVLREDTPAAPTEPYGRSKLAAERGLAELDIDWVALRPVLVYGPGVKGNMAALLKLARAPWPLPLGSLKARRSLLAVDNLAAAVDLVLKRAGAAAPAAHRRRPRRGDGGRHRRQSARRHGPGARRRADARRAAVGCGLAARSKRHVRAARRLARRRHGRHRGARLCAAAHQRRGLAAARGE